MPTAFCVGNGPSLTGRDLDFIAANKKPGDISFASNHIHLMFPHTIWRPDVWVTVETPSFYPIVDHLGDACRIYLTTNRAEKVESYRNPWREKETISYLKPCEHLWCQNTPGKHPPTAIRFGEKDHGVCMYGGSGIVAIQLAVLGGFDPIVLLGHDGLYTKEAHHFDNETYNDVDWPDWLTPELRSSTLQDAHKKLAQAMRIKPDATILNCTAGGVLDCYIRTSLEEFFLCPESS